MFTGKLKAIYIGTETTQPMSRVESAQAVAGKGLETDRYATGVGSFAKPN